MHARCAYVCVFSSLGYVRKQIPVSGYLCPALIREGVSSAASVTS